MDHEVDIATITQVVSSIQRVVADFYGPQCSQTLMTSSTGKAVVSSDGMTILEALQPEHPVANLVFQSMKSCCSLTLDGSKLFLLYLSNMLTYLQQEMDQGTLQHGGTNLNLDHARRRRRSVMCVRKTLQDMITCIIPKLTESVFYHCKTVRSGIILSKVSSEDLMKNILTTAMMPHYSVSQCQFYSQLLLSSLPVDGDYKTLVETLQHMVNRFNNIVIKVPNRPYKDCSSFPVLLIKQTFKVKQPKVLTCGKLSAVMLNSDSNFNETGDAEEVMIIKESCSIGKFLESGRNLVEDFAKTCVRNKINIVLCTGSLPNYAVDIFSRNELCVVTNMFEDDIEMLQICSSKVVLTDLADDIDEMNVVSLSEVTEVIIGGRQYIGLQLEKDLSLKHLIVCAPTVGLCDQLALTLLKAVNALKLSLKPETHYCDVSACYREPVPTTLISNLPKDTSNAPKDTSNVPKGIESATSSVPKDKESGFSNEPKDTESATACVPKENESSSEDSVNGTYIQNDDIRRCFTIIEGGTSFEILLANLLQNYVKDCYDSNLAIVCKALGKTMYSVVQKLYDNTNIQPRNKHSFLTVETLLKEKVSDQCLWSLDRRGRASNLLNRGVFEPVIIKTHTLNCVLNLIYQLLSVDKIVSVKKINDD